MTTNVRTCGCGGSSRVVDVRDGRDDICWRRRECLVCGHRWTTEETRAQDTHHPTTRTTISGADKAPAQA